VHLFDVDCRILPGRVTQFKGERDLFQRNFVGGSLLHDLSKLGAEFHTTHYRNRSVFSGEHEPSKIRHTYQK
jgi:hypothetical protein